MSDMADAIAESRARFLAGDLTPELERHCRNVGRVAVEFACLEEDIGQLLVALETGRGSSDQEYMEVVRVSSEIPRRLRRIGKHSADPTPLDFDALADTYMRFKTERDRYAHSSVGSTLTKDGESRVLTLRSMQQKHARGDTHPKGPVSALPTDEETDRLCREMREQRQRLQDARLTQSMKRLVEQWSSPLRAIANRAGDNVRSAIKESLAPVLDRVSETVRGVRSDSDPER